MLACNDRLQIDEDEEILFYRSHETTPLLEQMHPALPVQSGALGQHQGPKLTVWKAVSKAACDTWACVAWVFWGSWGLVVGLYQGL
jgi:hypothetical protein